jgi:hypothetical protein
VRGSSKVTCYFYYACTSLLKLPRCTDCTPRHHWWSTLIGRIFRVVRRAFLQWQLGTYLPYSTVGTLARDPLQKYCRYRQPCHRVIEGYGRRGGALVVQTCSFRYPPQCLQNNTQPCVLVLALADCSHKYCTYCPYHQQVQFVPKLITVTQTEGMRPL